MNTKLKTAVPARFAKHPLALLVAAIASQGALAGQLPGGISISNVSVNSSGSYTYPSGAISGAAVCNINKAAGITVSADVSAGFTAGSTSPTEFGKCTEQKDKGVPAYYYKVGTYTVTEVKTSGPTVTADDKNSSPITLALTSAPTYSGNLTSPTTDNKYVVKVDATASETVTVTPYTFERRYSATDTTCSGTYNDTTAEAGKSSSTNNKSDAPSNSSKYYYVDLVGPTATHNIVGGKTIQQLTDLNLNIKTKDGSSEQDYSLRAGYDYPSHAAPTWGTEEKHKFDQDTSTGYDKNEHEHGVAVLVSCAVPASVPDSLTYTSRAQVTATKDLCGQDYAPPPIESTYSGKSGLFDVIVNDGCAVTNTAVVTAPLPPASLGTDTNSNEESYKVVECFTSQGAGPKGNRKVVSYPGTVHLGTVLNSPPSPPGGNPCDDAVNVGDVVFTVDQDFEFLKTGSSPQAHVFVGAAQPPDGWPANFGPGFWYHTGYPLVEINPRLIQIDVSLDKQTLTMKLGGTELGCGTVGMLPKGSTLYARAHTKFVGVPTSAENHIFYTTAAGLPSSSVPIIENPAPVACVNGEIPLPP